MVLQPPNSPDTNINDLGLYNSLARRVDKKQESAPLDLFRTAHRTFFCQTRSIFSFFCFLPKYRQKKSKKNWKRHPHQLFMSFIQKILRVFFRMAVLTHWTTKTTSLCCSLLFAIKGIKTLVISSNNLWTFCSCVSLRVPRSSVSKSAFFTIFRHFWHVCVVDDWRLKIRFWHWCTWSMGLSTPYGEYFSDVSWILGVQTRFPGRIRQQTSRAGNAGSDCWNSSFWS